VVAAGEHVIVLADGGELIQYRDRGVTQRHAELAPRLHPLAAIRQNDYVFPGRNHGKPLSNMSMLMVLRRLRPGKVTVHGCRSAFRDWAAEHGVSRELAEASLAHVLENKTEAAYRRGDLLEPRRRVMQKWSSFLQQPAVDREVVPLRRKLP
jgi:integrase